MLEGKLITVGICACSPAPKTLDLIRLLRKKGAEVHAILTPNALHFVPPLLVQRETGTPIQVEAFKLPDHYDSGHKSLSGASDLLLLAPVSANTLGKAANGIADNLLSTTVLSVKCPIIAATHINPTMYANKGVQRNIRQLKEDGMIFVESDAPRESLFPSVERIVETVERALTD